MNKRHVMYFLALTIGFILALGDVSGLFAQETNSEEFTLEEITVTAQKRSENQQKVPIAMETISGDSIRELGKTDIDQILSTVSSVIINKATDGMRVTLRGMSNDNQPFQGRQVSTPTVAVNMDGAYTNRNSSGNNLYDVDRVEVLYGPQSTMYAASTPGGVVNVITANPKLEKYEGSVILEGGNYNLKHAELSINAPVASKLALRVAASINKRDGYLNNGADDEDTKSARLKTLFQATEKLSFVLIGELSKQGGQGMGNNGVNLFDKQSDIPNPWTAAPGMGETTAKAQPSNDSINKKYSGRMDWDMGFGSLAIIPSFTPRNNDTVQTGEDRSGNPTVSYGNQKGSEKSVEARMTSSTDFTLFKWIAGVAWYHSWDQSSSKEYLSATGALNSSRDGYQNQRTKAIFANVTYPVTDQFRATGGLRYSQERNYSNNFESGRNNDANGVSQPEIVDMKYSSPDYKLGVEYDLAENSMLYSDFSTSYRTQGMGTTDTGEAFPPEKLKAITLGAKNRFLGNKMQVNASAFYYMYKNYMAVTGVGSLNDNYVGISPQTGLPVAAGDGRLQYIDVNSNGKFDIGTDTPLDGQPGVSLPGQPPNDGTAMDNHAKEAGDAKVYGFDLQTTTMVTQNFKVDLSASYLKKYFTHLFFDFSQLTNDLGVPDLDYSGKQMTFAPSWTVNVSLSYNIPLWNGGALTPRLDSRYQTSYKMYFLDAITGASRDQATGVLSITTTDVRKYSTQEPYHISDFTLVYAHPTGNWTLTGYVKNLENYALKKSIFSGMDGVGTLTIGPPRTYGGVLSVRF